MHSQGATGLPGNYKFGAYYDSGKFSDLSNTLQEEVRGNYGLYMLVDQMLYREGGPQSQQGLTSFVAITVAPLESRNTLPLFVMAGVVYRGLFRGRDNDTTGVGWAYGKFSRELHNQDVEMVLEFTHRVVLTPWLSVQPDVQYIFTPGGTGDIPNALVLGIELAVSL